MRKIIFLFSFLFFIFQFISNPKHVYADENTSCVSSLGSGTIVFDHASGGFITTKSTWNLSNTPSSLGLKVILLQDATPDWNRQTAINSENKIGNTTTNNSIQDDISPPDTSKPFKGYLYSQFRDCSFSNITFNVTDSGPPPGGGDIGASCRADGTGGLTCKAGLECLGVNTEGIGICGTKQVGVDGDCSTAGSVCVSGTSCDSGTKKCTKPSSIITNTPLSQPCSAADSDLNKGCVRINTALGTVFTGANNFTRWVLGFVLSISGGIVILIIIISGYRLMTSQGDPEKIKNARDQLTAAIVGLLFIIFSLVILELITRDILGLPGFGN